MLIKSLYVEGVGKFSTPAHVEGLGPGVNLLAACNEAGKSTLFRAIRTCFFKRHTASDRDVEAMSSEDARLPITIVVGFELNGSDYEIRKSYLRSASAQLFKDGREVARSREADDYLWELLGIKPGGARGPDEGAFALLWVGQTHAIKLPKPTEGAVSALTAAIACEVGAIVGGDRARKILSVLGRQIDSNLTSTGRAKTGSPLGEAHSELTELTKHMSYLQQRQATLEEQFEKLATGRTEHARLQSPIIVTRLVDDLSAARRELDEAHAAIDQLEKLEGEMTLATNALHSARRDLENHKSAYRRIDTSRQRIAGLQTELKEIRVRENNLKSELARLQEELRSFDDIINKDGLRERRLRSLAAAILATNAREEQSSRLEMLTDIADRKAKLEAELKTLPVNAELIREIDQTEREQGVIAARLAAGAPQLSVELGPAASGRVTVEGRAFTASRKGPVTRPIRVVVLDIATITVSPPQGYGERDSVRTRQLSDRLQQLIATGGGATVADTRARFLRRQELENRRNGLITEMKALGIPADQLADAVQLARQGIAQADAVVSEALIAADLHELPSSDDVELERQELRAALETAQLARERIMASLDVQNEALQRSSSERGIARGALDEVSRSLAADVAAYPDEARDSRIGAAEQEAIRIESQLSQIRAAHDNRRLAVPSQQDLERLKLRVERLTNAEENRTKRVHELNIEIGKLEALIQNAGGDGLGEQLSATQGLHALAERNHVRLVERMEVLKLLRSTIKGCLDEGQERFYAPVRKHLQPFLNDLFPGAQIELGDGFHVDGLRRSSGDAEPFVRLSDGTQEQIAVLVRLALGSMLAERGQPVPIILDDALVYCDDDRIQRMFDCLTRAGKQQQILVLTCRMRAFDALGGRTLRIITNGTEQVNQTEPDREFPVY